MHRGKSSFRNKRIVADRIGRMLIAIFAEHSTPLQSNTIILSAA